jgi:hypothetical protein
MKRTPALTAAAAALGLMAGLGLEARASTLDGEVSPHTVTVAWHSPGAPAGVELDEPSVVPPQKLPPAVVRKLHAEPPLARLAPMRARVPDHVVAAREARLRTHRTLLARDNGCRHAHGGTPAEARRS